ncbi:prepilin peptidase [Populibacterium corticicola]|uniref:Prepilin leader peptidase/N-methyltransferase n=1 Tax=Populibacterium corticicola TaxID=1812826 RepID=A0ABW5XC47_9MICO
MFVVLCGLFGLAIGSFLNVVIWRLPRGENLNHPPSACPKCGNRIKPYDNIPVLSWLILRGKCRNCKDPISARYPVVETLTGLVFTSVAWKFESSIWTGDDFLVLLPFLYVGAIGVALAFIDLDTQKLPNKIVLPGYIILPALLAVATWVMSQPITWMWRALLAGAILYVFYFLLCIVGGMGFGDVKLAGLLGMALGWLGWEYLIIGAFMPFLLGGIYSLTLIALGKAGRKDGIPFGPWMILGYLITFITAPTLSSWYLNTFVF